MLELSHYAFVAALVAVAGAFALYVASTVVIRSTRTLGVAGGGSVDAPVEGGNAANLGRYGTILAVNAFVFLTASLLLRSVESGHGPFSNMYEFSLAFAWGALAMYLYFEVKFHLKSLGLLVMPVTLGMLIYATTVPDRIDPLVPALQNNLLLTIHVATAVIAYGAFALGFASAVLYLVQKDNRFRWLPRRSVLDEMGYRSVMVGFPMMAAVIVLGAVWAEIAWGTYWSWDPKETASLVTWLLYGGYLHARVMRGWKGDRSAALLILGFGATMFTYYGNLFFSGLHSYG